jgi:hypothetical protein
MPRILESTLKPDPSLAPRSVVVDVVDGSTEQPMPGVEINFKITERSIAKGDSTNDRQGRTDATGSATFDKLDFATPTEYRAIVTRDGATFSTPPFQLAQVPSLRATLYVFPVVRNIREAAVLSRGFTFVELLDDVLQIDQAYRIFNMGSTAWQAEGVKVQLPPGAKAFSSPPGDLLWTQNGDVAMLRGTVTPGQHEASFRFQIPWNGERDLSFELGVLPQVQQYRLASDGPAGLKLSAEGFSEAEATQNANGQRVLLVDRALARPDPTFKSIKVMLANMPVRPVGRWYAAGIAALAFVGGIYAANRLRAARPSGGELTDDERVELEEARERLLDELAELDKARRANDIGPKTYEQARRTLTDALARLLTRLSDDDDKVKAYQAKLAKGRGTTRKSVGKGVESIEPVEPVELSPRLGETHGGNPWVQGCGLFEPGLPWGFLPLLPPVYAPPFPGGCVLQRVDKKGLSRVVPSFHRAYLSLPLDQFLILPDERERSGVTRRPGRSARRGRPGRLGRPSRLGRQAWRTKLAGLAGQARAGLWAGRASQGWPLGWPGKPGPSEAPSSSCRA